MRGRGCSQIKLITFRNELRTYDMIAKKRVYSPFIARLIRFERRGLISLNRIRNNLMLLLMKILHLVIYHDGIKLHMYTTNVSVILLPH